jgi:hypothetical protein
MVGATVRLASKQTADRTPGCPVWAGRALGLANVHCDLRRSFVHNRPKRPFPKGFGLRVPCRKLSQFRNGAAKSVGVRCQSGMSAYAPGGFTRPSHCPGAPIFVCDDG